MSRTISQAERIKGERQHRLGAQSSVVDRFYRLQPADLGGIDAPPRAAAVRHVSAQGIEQPQPLLHLEGLTKPLLLDAANVAALTRITASPLQRDWVGRAVVLAVVPADCADGSPSSGPNSSPSTGSNGSSNASPNHTLVIRLFAPDDPYLNVLRRRSQAAARARATAAFVHRALRYASVLLALLVLLAAAFYLYQNWATLVELGTTLAEGLLNP
jgi:hypothetical protein